MNIQAALLFIAVVSFVASLLTSVFVISAVQMEVPSGKWKWLFFGSVAIFIVCGVAAAGMI